jgi:hypothetical protein
MEKPTRKQYVKPTLKEHGVVRELTQTGSGDKRNSGKSKRKNKRWKWWKKWW